MTICTKPLPMSSPEITAQLATDLAPMLRAGDAVLLDGPVGAGKSHFARALVLARLAEPEDVPSPTFTLVQSYGGGAAGGPEIWHCDLYRLNRPDEVLELGLDDAFESAICLIEWPERLGDLTPKGALSIKFELTKSPQERLLTLSANTARWAPVLDHFNG
ncbi:MAG: tRNA (adenosine(37)-N6)-threonylcarbamoyltransferase complex ATPase subunit type 1 TsaE [Halocynthiibacter sp.]